eukprot:TRINITY_DN831_c0_g1_i1.p1 TRINITY_DN831_c0_g1~~TRINITY_DN831_c0_g1_i1.p1  ORF type:complete len:157 (-),score=41.49 TRINITY_DN831_c0_g1_i1:158-628(-)
MSKATLFVTLFAILATCIYADIWSDCGTSSDHFQIGTVSIIPDPPVKGQPLTVSVSGTLNEEVTAGNISIYVKYGFITILKQTDNICDQDYLPCPIQAGPYTHNITETIPADTPSGHYTGQVQAIDQNKQEILCVSLNLQLSSGAEMAEKASQVEN